MKATLTIILIFGIQIIYCQSVDNFINPEIKVNNKNIPIDKKQSYFPLELFPEKDIKFTQINDSTTQIEYIPIENEFDTFIVNWYSKHLHAMEEPLLFNKQLDKEVFRFTWLRSFDNPIAIRIEKNNEEYRLYWKLCNGAGGYEPGEIEIDKSKKLKKKHWEYFKKLINNCDFWNMELGRTSIGNDGSEWIMEGNDTKKYRVVSEWSPDDGAFYNACNYLIELTNLKFKKRQKY